MAIDQVLHVFRFRDDHLHIDLIFLSDLIDNLVGFLRQPTGINRHDAHVITDPPGHIDEHHGLGLKAGD